MINRSSKHSVRNELRRKTEEFVSRGGEIKHHSAGETGEPQGNNKSRSAFISGEPRKTRTYINDVVSALDERKQSQIPPKKAPKSSRPKKRIIYDDFGEAIREVWVDQ
ncbi:MAG: hypothetical protein P8Q37_06470 [Porticoccaceae bacterium]|nr:hypothetical protein [Porticoccaceae bacterium]